MYPFQIKALSESELSQANALKHTVFKHLSHHEKMTLNASLNPLDYKDVYEALSITSLRYWVAIMDACVVGLVGLYEEQEDDIDSIWLGWYCVDERYRGHRLGKRLLDFAIDEAVHHQKTTLKLYTTEHDVYAIARDMYLKRGFTLRSKKGKTLYYQLTIEGK